MKTQLLKRIWTTAGVLGLLADAGVAGPPAAATGAAVNQTNSIVAAPGAPQTPQPQAAARGAFAPESTARSQWPGYSGGNSPLALGGQFGPAPAGGTFYAGSLGGIITGQNPPGGRLSSLIIGGAASPGSPPGGMMSGMPAGGYFGSNVLGGLRTTPSNSFNAGPRAVIAGGAQTAGASPGGVLVAGAPPGGVMAGGASTGGIIVGGATAGTNAPGGQLH
jgi:hypothetical protein